MPKLWNTTIEEHRREVRDAILDATTQLIDEHGLLSISMAQVAEATGIGRATLYKYYPDLQAILVAWHERRVAVHLKELERLAEQDGDAFDRLRAVLETYAFSVRHEHHGGDLAAVLHRGEHVAKAHGQLRELVRGLIQKGVQAGKVRGDVAADELATYCLHALAAATGMPSQAAVRRLVMVTLSGLRTASDAARRT